RPSTPAALLSFNFTLRIAYFDTIPLPPEPALFPYTTLFRSRSSVPVGQARVRSQKWSRLLVAEACFETPRIWKTRSCIRPRRNQDRKSTRLNSSHLVTSYAVFCLKKKIHRSTVRAL